jgi:hypothetical protein
MGFSTSHYRLAFRSASLGGELFTIPCRRLTVG